MFKLIAIYFYSSVLVGHVRQFFVASPHMQLQRDINAIENFHEDVQLDL